MKKLVIMIMFIVLPFLAFGCGGEEVSFKVIAPNGSPALSQVYMQSTKPSLGDNVNYEIDIVSGTDPLVAAFGNNSYEFIYAPSNLGAKIYNANANYQLVGTVVWGNLYFATCTDAEFNLEYLSGKDITLFGQNTVPGFVAESIINMNNIVVGEKTFLASTAETVPTLVQDNSKIILVAEPSLSSMRAALAKKGVTNLKTINLTDKWADATDTNGYPQACLFVNKDFASKNHDLVEKFASALEDSCNKANEQTDDVAQMAVDLEYTFALEVLKGSIKNSNLEFKNALDSKDDLEFLLNKMIDAGLGKLVGNKLPDSEFYFS